MALAASGCLSNGGDGAGDADDAGTPAFADCLSGFAGLDLHTATIARLQGALTNGTVTSLQLVEAYSARIAAFDASDAQPGDFVTAQFAATPTILSAQAIADRFFTDVDAIVGPGLSYVSIGAAAGYPTVIVPAGYDEHDPQGISFFGPAWSDEELLVYAYAYEQASLRRVPPTIITPTLLEGVCTQAQVTATSTSAARFD